MEKHWDWAVLTMESQDRCWGGEQTGEGHREQAVLISLMQDRCEGKIRLVKSNNRREKRTLEGKRKPQKLNLIFLNPLKSTQ